MSQPSNLPAQLAEFFRQPAGRRLVIVASGRVATRVRAAAAAADVRLAWTDAGRRSPDELLETLDRCAARNVEVVLIENFDAWRSEPRFDWQVRARTQEHRRIGYLFVVKPESVAWLVRPQAAFHKQLTYVEIPPPPRVD